MGKMYQPRLLRLSVRGDDLVWPSPRNWDPQHLDNRHISYVVAWHFAAKGHKMQTRNEGVTLQENPKRLGVRLEEFELHKMEAFDVPGLQRCVVLPSDKPVNGYMAHATYDEFLICLDHYTDEQLMLLPWSPFGPNEELRDFDLLEHIQRVSD